MSKALLIPFDPSSQPPHPLVSRLPAAPKPLKAGTTRTHIFLDSPQGGEFALTALASLSEGYAKKNAEEKRECVRKAVGSAAKKISDFEDGINELVVDVGTNSGGLDAHAACKISLALLTVQKGRRKSHRTPQP
jgi:cytosol aminopeptidase